MDYKYDVALSFAGEDREYVEKIALILKANGVKVFYDKFEEVDLWGKDLGIHFEYVYNRSAKYCVPFISQKYQEKVWTKYEIRNAISRSINSNEDYILPIKIDDVKLEGLRESIGYLSAKYNSPEEIANKIIIKLGREASASVVEREQDNLGKAVINIGVIADTRTKDTILNPTLTFNYVNKVKDIRYYNQPVFKVQNSQGEERSFLLIENYERISFPIQLQYGQPLNVSFKLTKKGIEHIADDLNAKLFAEITTTLGERIYTNEISISEILKDINEINNR